ncbi:unnamed protein product [Didymodactylos carnosus]|uniref:Dihydrolipoamide dehydrogenase n=1 Tax=Didymodactylos carnosus TaxID=1234261 RepID=A0A814RF11_9BILA|nr:unnamed protein product [Didymodactylos carnosus]CAF3895145.1 unnamed protein product [Didymodactylos carnosus]
MEKYDAIIIGFGKGGKTLAPFFAKQGLKVAMIEESKQMYGGTCINIGCIPSKSLEYYAKKSKQQKFQTYEEQDRFFQESIGKKDALTAKLRTKNYDNLNTQKNIKIYNGHASFVSKNLIEIDSENGRVTERIQGDKIFINTGALPLIPSNICGIKESKCIYTSKTIMELKKLPKTLVIIGAGYIGLEFASIFSDFGSKVTLFEASNTFLSREDEDISKAIYDIFIKKGINIIMNAKTQSIEDNRTVCGRSTGGAKVTYTNSQKESITIQADAILVAVGRSPNVCSLGLENAGVKVTKPKNYIQVNEKLETTTRNIWALGDVNGGPQHTYISLDDYRIIRDQLTLTDGSTAKKQQPITTANRRYVPYTVYMDPELSRVGLTEKEAISSGYKIKIFKKPTMSVPRAHQLEELDGLLKVIIDTQTNLILGAALYCVYSSEVINIIRLAMVTNQEYTVLRDSIYTHPTMAEMLNDLLSD